MFERRHQPLISPKQFALRIFRCMVIAAILVVVTILIGAIAFHSLERLSWIDSLLNAVLIMTGLGLTVTLQTGAAKVFMGFYAIVSAIIFFTVIAILLSPLVHRFFHHFHLDLEKGEG